MGSETYTISESDNDGSIETNDTFSTTLSSFPIGKGYSSPDKFYDKLFTRWYVNIPNNATIISAYMSLYWDSAAWATLPTCNIYFDKQENSGKISSENDFDGRTKTTNYASWEATWATGWNNTSSLVTPLQELVNAYNITNKYIQALIVVQNPTVGGSRFKSYDGSNTYAPRLYVEWLSENTISSKMNYYRARRVV